MDTYQIDIKPTANPNILKFEANRFLTKHESFEFASIDETANSPIAQKLFYLPFVKKVFIAQNFIAIEKYAIVSWEEVQEETAAQIADYLNQGELITKDQNTHENKKIAITVYAEVTPNPAAMKFVSNKKLVINACEFKNIDDAKDAPLAQALFHFPFVKEVYIDANFVSISKYEIVEWEEITTELRTFIRTYLIEGKTIVDEEKAPNSPSKTKEKNAVPLNPFEGLDDTSKEIVSILEEYVKPAVASDGGNIAFESYDAETKKVKVILQGACSGCPSSTLTLKNGIEAMLKEMMHGRVELVEAVNG